MENPAEVENPAQVENPAEVENPARHSHVSHEPGVLRLHQHVADVVGMVCNGGRELLVNRVELVHLRKQHVRVTTINGPTGKFIKPGLQSGLGAGYNILD